MGKIMNNENLKTRLDTLYKKYNKRAYVHPDPLEFLYEYKDIRDREIVGLIASALAYGRVAQILKSVSSVLDLMGPSPCQFLMDSSRPSVSGKLKYFKHRFADGKQLSSLLNNIKKTVNRFGSLNACFLNEMYPNDKTLIPALTNFSHQLAAGKNSPGHLIPLPEKGSACKRMNLFLRWMARKDDVDPGGWEGISPSSLIIPLDTHMHKISLRLGLTKRKQANMITALEITAGFNTISPDDPTKYDFSLTRLGIRNDACIEDIV